MIRIAAGLLLVLASATATAGVLPSWVSFDQRPGASSVLPREQLSLARIIPEALPVAQIGSQERLAVSLYGAILGSNRCDEGAESARS